MIQTAASRMTEEEYIQHELKGERRSEYINGRLFEMPGEKDYNNELALTICFMLVGALKPHGFRVYVNDIKVALASGGDYRYPDVFVTKEARTPANQYVKREPVIIVEVVSPGSHRTDYVDKFIEYTQLPSLQYYLIVEPDTVLVTVCYREGGDWVTQKYTRLDDSIQLPSLGITLPMVDVYADFPSNASQR